MGYCCCICRLRNEGLLAWGPRGGPVCREYSNRSAEPWPTLELSCLRSATALAPLGSPSLVWGLLGAAACSAALRCAFSMISSCFFLSFARMGTRSDGTGVLSLKFFENPRRSFNLTFLSCMTLARRSSATRIFCFSENCLNAFKASTSTLPVAFDGGALANDDVGVSWRVACLGTLSSLGKSCFFEGVETGSDTFLLGLAEAASEG